MESATLKENSPDRMATDTAQEKAALFVEQDAAFRFLAEYCAQTAKHMDFQKTMVKLGHVEKNGNLTKARVSLTNNDPGTEVQLETKTGRRYRTEMKCVLPTQNIDHSKVPDYEPKLFLQALSVLRDQ